MVAHTLREIKEILRPPLASLSFVEKIQSLESDKDNLAETLESSVRRVVEKFQAFALAEE